MKHNILDSLNSLDFLIERINNASLQASQENNQQNNSNNLEHLDINNAADSEEMALNSNAAFAPIVNQNEIDNEPEINENNLAEDLLDDCSVPDNWLDYELELPTISDDMVESIFSQIKDLSEQNDSEDLSNANADKSLQDLITDFQSENSEKNGPSVQSTDSHNIPLMIQNEMDQNQQGDDAQKFDESVQSVQVTDSQNIPPMVQNEMGQNQQGDDGQNFEESFPSVQFTDEHNIPPMVQNQTAQNQQSDVPPVFNSAGVFNNAIVNNQMERRQLLQVPEANGAMVQNQTVQTQQCDAPPVFNSAGVFNNNQLEEQQLFQVPQTKNETIVQNQTVQTQQCDAPPVFNSTAVFNNAPAYNPQNIGQLFQVPDADGNITLCYKPLMVTNPQPRRALIRCPNSQMIAASHALQNSQHRRRLPIPVVRLPPEQNVRYITQKPGPRNVQIQQAPLTSRQPLVGKRIFNNQGQQFFRVPNQPYNLVAASNSNVYHSTAAPRFINAGLNQNNVYQYQARGIPANPTHYNLVSFPGVIANNSNTINENQVQFLNNFMQYNNPLTINNIASSNVINENNDSQYTSAFVPPGQYNSNSSSSRLNINQNSDNEVNQQVSQNAPVNTDVINEKEGTAFEPIDENMTPNDIVPLPTVNTEVTRNTIAEIPTVSAQTLDSLKLAPKVDTRNIANKVQEVPKETPKFVSLPFNESTTPEATNIKVSSGTQPRRRRKQDLNKFTVSHGPNLNFEFINIDPDTNNVESNQIPIIKEASSLQSDIATSSNVNESNNLVTTLEQNEPMNKSSAKKRKLQMKCNKNETTTRRNQKYSPKIKEGSSSPIAKRKSRRATKRITYNEDSQDSSENLNDAVMVFSSMNLNAAAIPNTTKDVTTNNLKPNNVNPASPQNINTSVLENLVASNPWEAEYIKFLRKRNDNRLFG